MANKKKTPMKCLKLDRSKLPELVNSLIRLLTNYQLYCQKLEFFLKEGNYKNFTELQRHFKALYRNTNMTIEEIMGRIQILNYTPAIGFQKCPVIVEDGILGNAQNIPSMLESIVKHHEILVNNMQNVIPKATIANDKNTINLVCRLLQYIEIQSWILGLWTEMHIEILSQRFSLIQSKSKSTSKSISNSLDFRRIDLLKYSGL